MDALRKLQQNFLGYLLDDGVVDIVRQIESTPRRSAVQRMALYGNAYVLRLKEALRSDYERLHGYLGDELFDMLIQQYIARYPSHYPSLRDFGQYLPVLTEQLAPFNEHPEVTELAHIELAFINSFDAADDECMTVAQLASLDPSAWATLSLRFHAAVQLLPLRYNSFPIWRALANEETPPEKIASDTTWLIWRENLVSRYRALEPAEHAALNVAMSGGDFAQVCTTLLEFFAEDETPLKAVCYLKQWVHDKMICG